MKAKIQINNTTRAAIDEKLVQKAAKEVIAGEKDAVAPAESVDVSVAFVGPARIRQLNKTYRKHDTVTDVLSFGEDESCGDECDCDCGCDCQKSSSPLYLGELVICLSQVKKDAKESKVSVDYELAWVVVHGVLHLLGYDHEVSPAEAQKMRQKEESYLSKFATP